MEVAVYFDQKTLAVRSREQWIDIICEWIKDSWIGPYVNEKCVLPQGLKTFAAQTFEYELQQQRFVYLGNKVIDEDEELYRHW